MSTVTRILGLFKYDTEKDKKSTFDIDKGLNENWDKIDQNCQAKAEKGQPNGYASLTSEGKVPVAQLPSDLTYEYISDEEISVNFPELTTISGAVFEEI